MPYALITTYSQPGTINKDGRSFGGNRIAADPHFYPAGTLIAFTWHRRSFIGDVSDTGSKIKGNHFDVPVVKMSSWIGVLRSKAKTTTLHHVHFRVIHRGRRRHRSHHK